MTIKNLKILKTSKILCGFSSGIGTFYPYLLFIYSSMNCYKGGTGLLTEFQTCPSKTNLKHATGLVSIVIHSFFFLINKKVNENI